MSSQQRTAYPNDSQQYLSSYPPQQQQDQYKASYDDLIDEYAAPYDRTSRHQTFAIQAPSIGGPTQQSHGAPYPHESKASYSTEFTGKDIDDEELDSSPRSYPPAAPPEVVDTGTVWSKLLPDSIACRLYVLTILVETTIDLAIEGDLLVRFHEAADSGMVSSQIATQKMPVYLSIFALAHVFQFGMAVDAVYSRNTLQFICLTMFNALFLVYAVIQIGEIKRSLSGATDVPGGISHIPINILTTIIPIVIGVSQLVYIGLGWKIYNEFGWKVYKFLGADRRIKKMYANYQIFECLIKFDVFFWVGFSVQLIWLVLHQADNWEYYVTCAALPLSIVLLVEGHLGARHENKWMMATFISGCVGALVYFIYKLVKILLYRNTEFLNVYQSLATFSVIAIVLLITTFIFAVMVMNDFGRGLKTQMSKSKKSMQHGRWKSGSQHAHHRAMSANPNRMSID